MNNKNKKNLTRRSFLKVLGTALASHFVFLNWGKKKAWAQIKPDQGTESVITASGFIQIPPCSYDFDADSCGQPAGNGVLFVDTCEPLAVGSDPDKCGTPDAKGNLIEDHCGFYLMYHDDPDKCGEHNANNGVIPDDCMGMGGVNNEDRCGWEDNNKGTIPDICSKMDPDHCGWGTHDEGVVPDTCDLSKDNTDKCGQKDHYGKTIPDTCDDSLDVDPDVCGIDENGNEDGTDACNDPLVPDVIPPK